MEREQDREKYIEFINRRFAIVSKRIGEQMLHVAHIKLTTKCIGGRAISNSCDRLAKISMNTPT